MACCCHYTRDPWYLISVCLRRQGRDPGRFRRLLERGRPSPAFAESAGTRTPPPLEELVRALPYLAADPKTLEKLDDAYAGELFPKLDGADGRSGPVPFAPLRTLRRFSPRREPLDDFLLGNACGFHAGGPPGKGVCLLLVEPGASPLEQFPGTRLWIGAREQLRSGAMVLAAARNGAFLLRVLRIGSGGRTLIPINGRSGSPEWDAEQVRRRIRWLLPVLEAEIRLHG